MTAKISRDDVALYVMGAYDGDAAALEARIADDAAARAMLAEEAELELALREAAAAGTFCPNCDDLVAETIEPLRCGSCGTAVHPGGYAVERVIVANAHGRMYVARDADGTRVALKELAFVQSPSSETIAAFEREAKFLRALEHAAIPRFLAAFEEGSGVHTRYYLAQELVEGSALDARLDEHFYSETEIVEIARQVLSVLVYLQGLSPMVIHRDIKPANLLRRTDGKIAVVDFGAAHVQGTTAGSTSIGTFGYMPLEQLAGQVDATTDTYALGASLLHLLTRREPWRVFGPATFEAINVSPALQRFLSTCVAPEPKDRFANAAAALAALDRLGEPVARAPRRIPRGAWRLGVGILAAALTLGGAGIAGYALRGEPEQHERAGRTSDLVRKLEEVRDDAAKLHDDTAQKLYYAAMNKANPPLPPPARFTSKTPVDLDVKNAPLAAVLRTIGAACGVSFVVPSYLNAQVTVKVNATPCSQIFEVILEAHDLGYVYDPAANLVRISSRKDIVHEREDAAARQERRWKFNIHHDEVLPPGPMVDLDYKDVPLREVLGVLAAAGKVNIVMPEYLNGQVTIIAKQVSWNAAVDAVLASQGMWYRYRAEGRLVRVATQKDLDHEDEDAADAAR